MAIRFGGPTGETLTGTDEPDVFDGSGGDDILIPLRSRFGNWDVVAGGTGFDTLVVDASASPIPVTTSVISGKYVLVSKSPETTPYFHVIAEPDVERVEITGGRFDDVLVGLATNDVLRGRGGADILDGSYGYDTLDGGEGSDVVDQRFWNGPIKVDLTVGRTTFPGDPNFDTLISIESFFSGNGADTLTGSAAANVLHGGGGSDVLNGLNGDDRLYGAAGDDRINGGNHKDTLYGGADDDELLGGSGNDALYGQDGKDDLEGGSGEDFLDGGKGFDKINGGAGEDTVTYEFYNGRTTVNLTTKRATFSGQTGSERLSSIENVVMGDGKDTVTGDGRSNTLAGGGGSDTLNGEGGNDHLYGDTYGPYGAGPAGADKLNGGKGDDLLVGRDGKDTLNGGLGHDKLYGGKQADIFDFNSLKDSVVGINRDLIADFDRKGGDRIDLSTIDANYNHRGNQTFKFIGNKLFSKTEGELRYTKISKSVIVEGDVNGDGKADLQIRVTLVSALDSGDFVR